MYGNSTLLASTEALCMKVVGSFRPNGSSAVSSTYNTGDYFTVSRSSQGLFLVTLTCPFMSFISILPSLQLSSAAGTEVQAGDADATAKTFYIRNTDSAGTAQDIASNANNRIHFEVYLQIGTC